jgi:hypothetical protein
LSNRLFIHARNLNLESHTSVTQYLSPDIRTGCEDKVEIHVEISADKSTMFCVRFEENQSFLQEL